MTVFFALQPRWFWTLITPSSFDHNVIYRSGEIEAARMLDYEMAERKKVPRGISLHHLFNETSRANLQRVEDALLQDKTLKQQFIHEYGQSLEDVSAVIVPAWEMNNDLNRHQIGLTEEAWQICKTAAADPNVEGFTIADNQPMRATYDGRPRIIITSSAFQSQRLLELTLLHELFHVLHVPARKPPFFLIFQNDLTYLPFYRFCTSNLEGMEEPVAWGWLFVFGVSCLVTIQTARRNHLRLKALTLADT